MEVRKELYDELQLQPGRSLSFRIGQLPIEVAGAAVTREDRPASSGRIGPEGRSRLACERPTNRYRVTIDYQSRRLTVAPAGGVAPEGTPVPVRVEREDRRTGRLSTCRSTAEAIPVTIDNGSAYTWVRQSAGAEWLRQHADWNRGVGAVGPSNMMMSGDTSETAGTMPSGFRPLASGPRLSQTSAPWRPDRARSSRLRRSVQLVLGKEPRARGRLDWRQRVAGVPADNRL